MVSVAEGKINLNQVNFEEGKIKLGQVNFEKVFALVEGIDKKELDGLYSAIAELQAQSPQDVWSGMNKAFVRHCKKAVLGTKLKDTPYDRFFARLLTILRRFCFKLTQQNLESVDILLLKAQYIDNCLQMISNENIKEVAEAKSQLLQLQVQRSSEVIQWRRQKWDTTDFMNVAIVCILALLGAIALDSESLIQYQLASIHDWQADLLNYMNNNRDRVLSEFFTKITLRLRF